MWFDTKRHCPLWRRGSCRVVAGDGTLAPCGCVRFLTRRCADVVAAPVCSQELGGTAPATGADAGADKAAEAAAKDKGKGDGETKPTKIGHLVKTPTGYALPQRPTTVIDARSAAAMLPGQALGSGVVRACQNIVATPGDALSEPHTPAPTLARFHRRARCSSCD